MMPLAKNPTSIIDDALAQFDKDGFKDGDIVSHDWIRWALDIKVPARLEEVNELQFLLLSRLDEFRDRLLIERKIALRNVRGDGYLIVPPYDQARYAAEQGLKYIRKGLEKAEELLEHARLDEMSTDERKRHVDAQCKFDGMKGIMTRQKRDVFALFGPKDEEVNK